MTFIPLMISRTFLRRVLSTKAGRAFALQQASDSESADEGQIFDDLLSVIDDPELQKLVRVHQADEERHAALFSDAAKRQGITLAPFPEHLQLLNRLNEALGDVLGAFAKGDRGIMDMYLLLQVIEERATTQFEIMEPILRQFDSQSADVLQVVAQDELRHLKYCRAIAKKYATSEDSLQTTLTLFREVEHRCFGEHSRANMSYILEQEIVPMRALERRFWNQFVLLGQKYPTPIPTRFAPNESKTSAAAERVQHLWQRLPKFQAPSARA